jgi:general stress protein CsbA
MRANFRYYLNWKFLPFVILLIFAGYCLPYTHTTSIIMVSTLLVFAGITIGYTYFKARKIKTDADKQSILKSYLMYYSNFPMILFNLIFNCLGFLGRNWPAASFLNPKHFTPVVFTLILSFFVTYLLANTRLTQQQLENAGIIGRV